MDLNFSYNWNQKLDSQAFTTIRKSYYRPGMEVRIMLNGKYLKTCIIVDVKSFKLSQLNSFMSFIDTGYDVEQCQKIIKTMYSKRYPHIENELFYFHLLNTIKIEVNA